MSYIGAGGSGRNTTILRANYKTPEGIAFYGESLKIYQQLSQELDFNLLISKHGHLTLAHSERSVAVQRERAEANQLMGVDSRWVEPDEVARLCPQLNMSRDVAYPIQGALYHPPGAVIRHDAVVWGYARKADAGGVHIHQGVEVTGLKIENGRCVGVETNRGPIAAGTVMSAVAGWTSTDHGHGRHRDAAHEPPAAGVRDRARRSRCSRRSSSPPACTCTSRRPTAASS